MKKFLIPIGSLLLVVAAVEWLLPSLSWDGGARVYFHVQIADQSNTRPIPNASISIRKEQDYSILEGMLPKPVLTDELGRAELMSVCGAGGSITIFAKTGRILVTQEIVVEAPGYRRISVPVANLVGKKTWPLKTRRFVLKLWMIRETKPAP